MCNATNKTRLHSFVAATAAFLSLFACGDKDADAAGRLWPRPRHRLDRGDYDSAFIYLDSLSAAYPRQIEAGRRGLALRPRAIEGRTNQEIIELQCYLQAHQATADSADPAVYGHPAVRGCISKATTWPTTRRKTSANATPQ